MKQPSTIVLNCLILLLVSCQAAGPRTDWIGPDEIVASIELPRIPDRDFSILDFGAPTDGVNDARPAIMKAIDAASEAGGGRVVLPEGAWYSKGPIHLKSRINLHLARGAHLLFAPEPEYYLPVVKIRWEGTEVFSYSPFIYARDVEDIAITGPGIIDGNPDNGFIPWGAKQSEDVAHLRQMGFDGVPVEQRVFGEGTFLRAGLIQLFGAERVLLENYTCRNSAFWINHLVYTRYATVRGLKVESHFANNDGIDIESSSLVLVENCLFRTGDDSVVVKSGRDLDGRTIGKPSEDIVVRNNDMGGEDGIGLGSEMSGGIRNVYFMDNVLREGSSAFRFKSNLDRGGTVEHIRVSNFKVESFKTLFWFQMNYPSQLGGNFPSTYRDIVFENIEVEQVGTVLEVHAPAASPLKDVLFKNIRILQAERTFILENAIDLQFENFLIGDQRVDGQLNWRAEQ